MHYIAIVNYNVVTDDLPAGRPANHTKLRLMMILLNTIHEMLPSRSMETNTLRKNLAQLLLSEGAFEENALLAKAQESIGTDIRT